MQRVVAVAVAAAAVVAVVAAAAAVPLARRNKSKRKIWNLSVVVTNAVRNLRPNTTHGCAFIAVQVCVGGIQSTNTWNCTTKNTIRIASRCL